MWNHRDVRIAIPATAVSLTGDAMALVALALRVHDSGAGPYAMTGLLLCFALPIVATMGLAGSVADRFDSRAVLAVTTASQVIASLGLAATDDLTVTYALVIVLQTGFAFSYPVWQALIPHMVGEDQVGRMVSLQQGVAAIASPLGAGVGGAVVGATSPSVVFLVDAGSYAVLLLGALALRTRRHVAPEEAAQRIAILPSGGLTAVRANPVVLALVVALVPFVVALEGTNVAEVFLVRDALDGTAFQYGLTQVATGVGAVAGAVAASLVPSTRRRILAILVSLAGMSTSLVLQGLAPTVALFLAFGVALGLANAVSNAAIIAVIIEVSPDRVRGQVLATVNGVARVATVAALALGGVLSDTLGPRMAFVVAGALGLATTVAATARLARYTRAGGPLEDLTPASEPSGSAAPGMGSRTP